MIINCNRQLKAISLEGRAACWLQGYVCGVSKLDVSLAGVLAERKLQSVPGPFLFKGSTVPACSHSRQLAEHVVQYLQVFCAQSHFGGEIYDFSKIDEVRRRTLTPQPFVNQFLSVQHRCVIKPVHLIFRSETQPPSLYLETCFPLSTLSLLNLFCIVLNVKIGYRFEQRFP